MSIFASFFKIFSEMVQGLVLSWMGLNKLVIFSFFNSFRICHIYLFVIWIIHYITSFFKFIFRSAEVDQKEAKTKQIEEQRYVNWQNLRYFIHSMFNIFFLFLAVLQKPAASLRILDFVPYVMCDFIRRSGLVILHPCCFEHLHFWTHWLGWTECFVLFLSLLISSCESIFNKDVSLNFIKWTAKRQWNSKVSACKFSRITAK